MKINVILEFIVPQLHQPAVQPHGHHQFLSKILIKKAKRNKEGKYLDSSGENEIRKKNSKKGRDTEREDGGNKRA